MNQLPRFGTHLQETSVRDYYEDAAQSTRALLWRRRWLILTTLLAGVVLGIAGLVLIRKSYTADALVQLTFNRDDQTRPRSGSPPAGPAVEATSLVESEARVLKSRVIARRVVARLNLANDPAFSPSIPLAMRIESWLPNGSGAVDVLMNAKFREDLIAQTLVRHLTVTNDARSYIIGISYTSPSPERSAKIVNAFLDEYIDNTMEAGVRGAQRTSDWIAQQIRQTRISLDAAEASVNAYRRLPESLENSADSGIPQPQSQTRPDEATATRLAEEARLKGAATDSRTRETTLKGLQLDATSLRDRLKLLTESYAQAVMAVGLASTNAQVVMRAESIPTPSGPNPLVIFAIALLGSLAAGVGAAFLLEGRRKGFRSEADLAAETQTPCLGRIPDLPAQANPSHKYLFDEAIRFVAASLDVQTALNTGRVLVLTSSVADEGKSEVGQALAEQAAKRNDRVLVIDVASRQGAETNGRTRSLNEAFDDPDGFLTGFAPGSITRLAAPRWVVSDNGKACLLADFVSRAKASFDLIVLEVPPVLGSLDFLPLARLAEQVVHLV